MSANVIVDSNRENSRGILIIILVLYYQTMMFVNIFELFCLLCKYNMYYIFVILLFPLSVLAGDMDKCTQEKDHDKKNMCMALAVGSVSYCEKLKKADDKMSCTFKVRDLQRKVMNQYYPMDDKNTQRR